MDNLMCGRCGRVFLHKGALTNHSKKITPCKRIIHDKPKTKNKGNIEILAKGKIIHDLDRKIFRCRFCGKEYTKDVNVYRHFKKCKAKIKDDEKDKIINDDKVKIRLLEDELEKVKKNPQVVNNTINLIGCTFNILEKGKNFETGTFIVPPESVSELETNFDNGMLKIIAKTFCNSKEYPDQLSIYKPLTYPHEQVLMTLVPSSHEFIAKSEKKAWRIVLQKIYNGMIRNLTGHEYDDKLDHSIVRGNKSLNILLSMMEALDDDDEEFKKVAKTSLYRNFINLMIRNEETLRELGIQINVYDEYAKKNIKRDLKIEKIDYIDANCDNQPCIKLCDSTSRAIWQNVMRPQTK